MKEPWGTLWIVEQDRLMYQLIQFSLGVFEIHVISILTSHMKRLSHLLRALHAPCLWLQVAFFVNWESEAFDAHGHRTGVIP